MEERYDTQKLLVLRKLTRATADLLRSQIKEYLATLSPLLRPRHVLGDYIQSSTKESVRGADAAFKQLQGLYETVAGAKPFDLPRALKPPIEIINPALEMTPMEYTYVAQTERESKTVTVTSPLQWMLNFAGFPAGRLRALLADRDRSGDQLQSFVLHYLVMHVVVSKQSGVARMLGALHFPIRSARAPDLGELPITTVASDISTLRPPDHVIIESTEISGMNAFEEIINLDDIVKLRNPLKEQLVELVKAHGEGLLPSS